MTRRRRHPEEHERTVFPWERLSWQQPLGKRVVVPFISANSAAAAQNPNIDLLDIRGEDDTAHQLCVTLGSVQAIPGITSATAILAGNVQNTTGEADNIGLGGTLGNAGGNPVAVRGDFSFANPVGILEWGICGISQRAEIDFLNGLSINLITSFVRLSAFVEGAPGQTTSSAPYVLSAFIGPGMPKPNNAQRTIQVGFLANGVRSSVFAVPRHAKSVVLVSADSATIPSAPVGNIEFWRSPAGQADALGVGNYLFAVNSQNSRPVPIPNGGYYFTVVGGYAAGAGGNANPEYWAVFELAI